MNLRVIKIKYIIAFAMMLQLLGQQKTFAQNCVTGLGTYYLSAPSYGDYAIVDVSCSPVWCDTWSAYTTQNWIYVNEDYGDQYVDIEIYENESEEERNGSVYIEGHTISVHQDGVCNEPAQPGSINGATTVCSNSVVIYDIQAVPGATSYTWSLSNGGTILNGQGSTTLEASFPNTGEATVSVYAVKACGNGTPEELNINIILGSSQSLENQDTLRLGACPILIGNQDITARDEIILEPGFSYTAESGTLFRARIDRSIRDDASYLYSWEIPDPEERQLDTTLMVGSTAGGMTITQLGGASYTIPLEVAPGVNGLSPGLSIVYSGSNGPGIAGYGWGICGLSFISRGPQTVYHDGITRGINMDINDRFYIDGQRLVNTCSTYGDASAQYQTDNDIFTRVTPQETNAFGPGWFKAETKSGLIYEYGNSPKSKQKIDGYSQILNWYVSRVNDLFGNHIDFTYIQDHYSMYPSEITYGPNVITFYYKNRSDTISTYFNGTETEQCLLLDKITVKYNSSLIKTYEFRHSYNGSSYNSYSILNEVVKYGIGTSKMNSTAFSYQIPANVNFEQTKYDTAHAYITYKSKLVTGDFNGDGKADFLCLPTDESWSGIRICFSDGSDNFYPTLYSSTSINQNLLDIRALDLNADGKDDILYETGTSSSTFKYLLCDGSSLTQPVSIDTRTTNANTGMTGKPRRTENRQEDDNEHTYYGRRDSPSALSVANRSSTNADYNGDGVNDIFLNDPDGNWKIYSFVNSYGQMLSNMNVLGYGTISTLADAVYGNDFNGDGKADIWSFEDSGLKIYTFTGSTLSLLYGSSWPTNKHFFELGDFNADGKVDMFLYGYGRDSTEYDWSDWQIRVSTGTDFEVNYIPKKKNNLKDDLVRLSDFNGDGSTDLMVTSLDQSWTGTYFYITKNKGTDFYTHNMPYYPIASHNYYLGDYNGDGHTDFICTDGLSPWWDGYQVFKTIGNTSVLMEEVANGLGLLTKLTYTKLSQATSSVYLRGNGAVYPVSDFQGPWNVVDSVKVDNSIGSMNVQSYYYEGAKIHIQGKGFLGYKKTRITDNTAWVESESISDYNDTYFYPQLLETFSKRTGTTDTIGKVVNTWDYIVLDTSTKRIFPYLQSSTQYNKLTGHSTATSTEFDSFGNLSSITNSYSGGPTETTSVTYSNTESSSKWLLGRPTKIITEFSDNDTTITKSVSKVYNSDNNSIIRDTAYAGTSYQIIHTYDYNSNGTLESETSTTNGVSRSKSYTYESDNIRIHTTTDPLSHVTTNIYDNFGRLHKRQDYLGNTSTYQYDEMGKPLIVSSTSGDQTTTVYSWENPTADPKLARYSILQSGNDGSETKSWYDKLGRMIGSDIKGFDGTMIYTVTKYNLKGQIDSISDPYYSTGTAIWNRYLYDNYGRKTNHYRPSGRNTSYQYSNNTVTETTAGKSFAKAFSSDGTMASATDAGGTITYSYYPDGKVKTITAPGGIVTSMEYDPAGNQDKLVDPSAGTITYTYNGFGELTSQVNAKNQTTSVSYNPEGTISQKVTPEGTTTYSYNANKQLTGISSPDNVSRSIEYDSKGRTTKITEAIPGTSSFSTSFTYDDKGRISTTTHPSGIIETNNYNSNGYLSSVSAGGAVRWTTTGMNAWQQITSGQYGSNLGATFGYNSYGFPTSTVTGTLQNYSYNFDLVTGNLNWRQNNSYSGLAEEFQYDNLDRLDNVYMDETMTLDLEYDSNIGGITDKSDVGTLLYNVEGKPYAVSDIDPSTGLTPDSTQLITYTSFESISTISENSFAASFTYNSDNERIKMDVLNEGDLVVTRWYPGNSFIKDSVSGVVKMFTYIGGDAYSAPVVAVTQNGSTSYYYLLKDYLGNITHIVNSSNSVVAEYSYDAWGRMRNPATWGNYSPGSEPALFTGRGFTGHEHLPWFNLINMNGRVYDPLLGMFLSPDNNVQSPDFTQNFNRYSYCLNNPLIMTDPSGELSTFWKGMLFAPFGIAAISPGFKYATGQATIVQAIGDYVVNAALFVAFAPVGGGTFVEYVAWRAGEGAIGGGLNAAIYGENIGKGMLKGAAIAIAFATITSENMSNLFKGENFYTNKNVFNNMMGRGMGEKEILDYFGFKGTYNPSAKPPSYVEGEGYYGFTDVDGEINYGDFAFNSYKNLKITYIKESYHSAKALSGQPFATQDVIPGMDKRVKIYPEERLGFIYAYKNQGLALHSSYNLISQINYYQFQSYNLNQANWYLPKWWHFIYKIPRRW